MPLRKITQFTRVCEVVDEKGKCWLRIEREEGGGFSLTLEGEDEPLLAVESEEDAEEVLTGIQYVVSGFPEGG